MSPTLSSDWSLAYSSLFHRLTYCVLVTTKINLKNQGNLFFIYEFTQVKFSDSRHKNFYRKG
jgi:hypothetical protein